MPESSDSNVRLFADESVLYRVIDMPEDSKQLQLHLLALERWEKEWLMSFNASKFSVIRITHVENVAAKGNRTLGFIKRNIRECTKPVKAASYTTLTRPVLEYASTVWDPTTQSNLQTMEQIQKRAARFLMNDYTTRIPGCVTRMQEVWDGTHCRTDGMTADSPCSIRLIII